MIAPNLIRRIQLGLAALAATVLALAWSMVAGSATPGAGPEPRRPRHIPFTDVHPYGANFFLEREPEIWKREKAVTMAAEAGIAWAKQHFPWSEIQEQDRGPYSWQKYDEIVDLYRRNGIEVIARLDWSPPWVRADFVPNANNPPDADHVPDFAAFAGEAARHFSGRVRFYQIWNEPNLRTEWANQPVDPEEYALLLAAASAAIRSADPDAVVVAAPLAITTETLDLAGNLSDLEYLDALYVAGAAEHFDVLSANAFGMDLPPWDEPAADKLNLRRIELQRQVMERHGDDAKAIWLNEYGWNAAPEDMPANRLVWRRVPEDVQAAWTVEGIDWASENWPWAGVFSIWYFQYYRPAEERAEFYFRMIDLDFTPRRLYAAVREAAPALRVAGPGEWGEHSPPVAADAAWRWEWSDGALDGNARVADATGATLEFQFVGSSVDVRVLGGADAGGYRVALDGGSLAMPPGARGDQVDGWRWESLAGDLAHGPHSLRLVANGDGPVIVDSFRVGRASGLAALMSPGNIALAALAAALAVMLVRDVVRAANLLPG